MNIIIFFHPLIPPTLSFRFLTQNVKTTDLPKYLSKYDFDKNTESDVISGCPNGWMEFRAKKNTCYKTVWETDPRAATDRIDLIRRNEHSQWGQIIIQAAFDFFTITILRYVFHSDVNKHLVNRLCREIIR